MLQSESLHLRHVLQAVSALEAVVLRSFGPDGGRVMFTRDAGQVMLTRHGTRILTALRLEHPIARMIVECVFKHSAATGDGSKTFILLLASLLRGIHTHTSREAGAGVAAAAKRLAEELLAFGVEELADVVAMGVLPHCSTVRPREGPTDAPTLERLLGGFLHTRLGDGHSDAVLRLACEMLSLWSSHDDPPATPLRFIDAHFPALHTAVSGFPVGCSRLIEGQVIHRDFSTPRPPADRQPIRALIVTEPLQPEILTGGTVLELNRIGGEGGGVGGVFAWAERRLECAFRTLQSLGVTLLLSPVKQSSAAVSLSLRAGVSLVDCVSEDEICLFSQLSGAEPVSDWSLIGQQNVAVLTFCQPILLGAHRFVHVGFPSPPGRGRVQPHSVVVCGSAEGHTDQSVCALRDALRMLLTTLEPTHRTNTPAHGKPSHTHGANTDEASHTHGTRRTDEASHTLGTRRTDEASHTLCTRRTDEASHTHGANTDKASHTDGTNTDEGSHTHGTNTDEASHTLGDPSRKCVLVPGSVIPVGGAFEWLLYHTLMQHCTTHTCSHTPSHSPSDSHTPSHTHTCSHTPSHSPSDSHTPSHTHTCSHTPSPTHTCSHPQSHTHTFSHSPFKSHPPSHTHTCSHPSSHTHNPSHSPFNSHTPSHTHTPLHFPSHTHSPSLSHTCSHTAIPVHSRLLAEALLSVPRQMYSHDARCSLRAERRVLTRLHHNGSAVVQTASGSTETSSGLESVACKYQLILAVLQCVRSLLRVDAVLRTHTPLHTHTHSHMLRLQAEQEED